MKTNFPTLLARASGVVALFLAPSSFAAVLLLTHTGTGSGSIGGTPFTNAAFTISDTVDTANRLVISSGGGYFIDDSSASIAITGVGTYTFTSSTRTFVNNSVTLVGFSRGGSGGLDLFDGPSDPVFSTWDLLTGIGPITGTGSLSQWNSSAVNTTGGVLIFSNGTSATTFTATAVPEPSVYATVTGLGVLACAAWRRRSIRSL